MLKLIADNQETMTTDERELVKSVVPDMSDLRLEIILRGVYHMGDERLKRLTWKENLAYCEDYAKVFLGNER